MQEIAPVRIQQADGMVFYGIGAHPLNIFIGIFNQINKLVPAAGARTGILHRSRISQPFRFLLTLILCIAPVQAHGFFGKLLYHLKMCIRDRLYADDDSMEPVIRMHELIDIIPFTELVSEEIGIFLVQEETVCRKISFLPIK